MSWIAIAVGVILFIAWVVLPSKFGPKGRYKNDGR